MPIESKRSEVTTCKACGGRFYPVQSDGGTYQHTCAPQREAEVSATQEESK